MKSLRKLLKGIVSDGVAIAVVLAILLALVVFGSDRSGEEVVLQVFFCGLFLVVVIAAVGIYLAVVLYRYGQAENELCAIPGFSKERFEREAQRAPQFVRLIAVCDAICYAGVDHMACVIPLQDVIWAYQPDGANVLNVYTRDREIHKISVFIKGKGNPQKGIRYLMRLIARKNKNALIGYNSSYEELYKHDFARLLGMAGGRGIVDSGWLEQEYVEHDYYHMDFQ